MLNNFRNMKSFRYGLMDYYRLLCKNYPVKETLKLVGNRYRLTRIQRAILYRGISSEKKALSRKAKMIPFESTAGSPLLVDGYNVLFTIMNYLLGKPVFICNDGILRDAGGVYGKIENPGLFFKAASLLVEFFRERNFGNFSIYLDQPVVNSSSHRDHLQKKIGQERIKGEVCLLSSVDRQLKQLEDRVIATSDSEIIDSSSGQITDLARHVLESVYETTFMDIGSLIQSEAKKF